MRSQFHRDGCEIRYPPQRFEKGKRVPWGLTPETAMQNHTTGHARGFTNAEFVKYGSVEDVYELGFREVFFCSLRRSWEIVVSHVDVYFDMFHAIDD